MRFPLCLLVGLTSLALCQFAHAQTAAKPAAGPAAASAPGAKAPTPANVTVIEDDNVRIEETRGRGGVVRQVTVQSKLPGAKPYEVQVAPAGRDPNQDKGSAGRRTWSVLNF